MPSISEAARQYRERRLSPVELTQRCLQRIEQLNPRLNAFLHVSAATALAEAQTARSELARGVDRGLLHGIPVAVKDLIDVRGVMTTAGSKILRGNVPTEDATAVQRLRAAGAVILGKLHLHEWALGVTNNNPHFGPCRNPWDLDRIPGGSSGGSAAAVTAGLCLGALGSDTGGSIRLPAALCGVVGFKPSYGRVSNHGVVPLSWSLDHVGPMARMVGDATILFQCIAAFDERDPNSTPTAPFDDAPELPERMRDVVLFTDRAALVPEVDPEVLARFDQAIETFPKLGAEVRVIDVPGWNEAREAAGVILLSEAAAYHESNLKTRPEAFGSDVLQRLRTGAAFPAMAYARARRAQAQWRRYWETALGDKGVFALPTTTTTAPLIAEAEGVSSARVLTRFTAPFNLAGVPAISVPCGFTSRGLPIGLQLVAAPHRDAFLLQVADAYQQATDWHRRRPNLP